MEFTPELILNLVLAIAPALTSIFGIIAAVIKLIKNNKNSNDSVVETVQKITTSHDEEIKTLRETCNALMAQNAELKKQQAKLISKLLHVTEKEE